MRTISDDSILERLRDHSFVVGWIPNDPERATYFSTRREIGRQTFIPTQDAPNDGAAFRMALPTLIPALGRAIDAIVLTKDCPLPDVLECEWTDDPIAVIDYALLPQLGKYIPYGPAMIDYSVGPLPNDRPATRINNTLTPVALTYAPAVSGVYTLRHSYIKDVRVWGLVDLIRRGDDFMLDEWAVRLVFSAFIHLYAARPVSANV